jgi:hypothetical protein
MERSEADGNVDRVREHHGSHGRGSVLANGKVSLFERQEVIDS